MPMSPRSTSTLRDATGRIVSLASDRDVIERPSPEQASAIVDALEQQGVLRALLGEEGSSLSESEARRRVEAGLVSGALALVRLDAGPRPLDAPEVTPLASLGEVPIDVPVERRVDGIGLRLVDADGRAVVDEPYELWFSDGSTLAGQTDAEGRAHHDQVSAGRCEIVLPRLWASEWAVPGQAKDGAAAEEPTDAAPGTPESAPLQPAERDPASDLVAEPDAVAPGCTFLVLELEEPTGRPLVDEPVDVTLPDGSVVHASTDDGGRVELTAIECEGLCRVTSPTGSWTGPAGGYDTGRAHVLTVALG